MSPALSNDHRQTVGELRTMARCQWQRLLARWPLPRLGAGPTRRFVIFGDGRTGSTLLVRLLDNHPAIHCDDEILHDWCAFPASRVGHHLEHARAEAYGFKLLTYQLTDVLCLPRARAIAFLDWLEAGGFRVIHLTRDNPVRHALSQIGARQHGFHRVRGDARTRPPIVVRREELFWWLDMIAKHRRDNAALLAGRDCLTLEYARDLEDAAAWPRTLARVADMLGLPTAPARADLEKLNAGALEDIVANADELRAFLRETPYAHFL
ncbi:MAG: Nodulation protein H [Gammaproteobacteria bacterium]